MLVKLGNVQAELHWLNLQERITQTFVGGFE